MPSNAAFARRSDDENTPPTARPANTRSKVRGGIQGAARRRRARLAGGPHQPRCAVEQAKQKNTTRQQPPLISIELPRDANVASASARTMTIIHLPNYLPRPIFRGIAKQTITIVAPELADTTVGYVRDSLESLGPGMLQVLKGVKAEPPPNIPKDIVVTVNDISSDMPTHMLGICPLDPPDMKRRMTLYPIHSIILATHCTHLPPFPATPIPRPSAPGSNITLPVVPLCLPSPEVFPQLSNFLYTRHIDTLLRFFVPFPVPYPLYCCDPTSEPVLDVLKKYTNRLATSFSTEILLAHIKRTHAFWRNVCALGMDDEKLWCALDVAWEVLTKALGISCGNTT